jgi:hypothetical protein
VTRRAAWLSLVFLVAASGTAAAQAWSAPAGVGSVSVTYQFIDNAGHRLTDGTLLPDGKSTNMGVFFEADYAFTDRFSISAGLPYVAAKYIGPGPPPPGIPYFPEEQCHCWNSGWQDFNVTARYNLHNGALGLTPSVSFGAPSHDYGFRGEVALGTQLKEARLGLDAGYRLDRISPRLAVQARYAYAIVERAIDISHNRSNAAIEGDYAITRKLSTRAFASWQRTHGGLRFGGPPDSALPFPGDVNTDDRRFQHDRLLRDNNWRLGAGAAYALPHLDVFASFIHYLKGTDAHAGHVLTMGVSWPFEF